MQYNDLTLQSPAQNGESLTSSHKPQMILNEYGTIAEKQWYWLEEQYPYVSLHAFVVMPNHIHGIIEINRSRIISSDPIKIKPLSELIGAYKTTVSKQIHLSGFMEFQWQRSFYEHIIRDEKTLETISDYIINNPVNWEQDKLYNL
jgi:REP element-mobilizing transposase RayT